MEQVCDTPTSLGGFKEAVKFVDKYVNEKVTASNDQEMKDQLKKVKLNNFHFIFHRCIFVRSILAEFPATRIKTGETWETEEVQEAQTDVDREEALRPQPPAEARPTVLIIYSIAQAMDRVHGQLFRPETKVYIYTNVFIYQYYIIDKLFSSANASNQDQLNNRLAKADYHGCLLMVTRSKCPSHVGLDGIVVMETKNTFQIICKDDRTKSKMINSAIKFSVWSSFIMFSVFIDSYSKTGKRFHIHARQVHLHTVRQSVQHTTERTSVQKI